MICWFIDLNKNKRALETAYSSPGRSALSQRLKDVDWLAVGLTLGWAAVLLALSLARYAGMLTME